MKQVYAVLRTSEFWTLLAQVTIESINAPVPEEFKAIGWAYIALRVASKALKYVFPNPTNPNGAWMKAD